MGCEAPPAAIGEMRVECLFESPVVADDGAGGQAITWGAPSFIAFAKVTQKKGSKKSENEKLTLVRTLKLTMWYNAALTENMRVTFKDKSCRVYDIENWRELDRYHIVTLQDGEGI